MRRERGRLLALVGWRACVLVGFHLSCGAHRVASLLGILRGAHRELGRGNPALVPCVAVLKRGDRGRVWWRRQRQRRWLGCSSRWRGRAAATMARSPRPSCAGSARVARPHCLLLAFTFERTLVRLKARALCPTRWISIFIQTRSRHPNAHRPSAGMRQSRRAHPCSPS